MLPVPTEYRPSAHVRHVLAAVLGWKAPAGHGAISPPVQLLPVGHVRHIDWPG